eukprot:sb/3467644/
MAQDTTDSVFAAICIICCLIGLPCNLIALRFFIRKTRDIPTIIYLAIAATDLATSLLVLPVGISMAMERQSVMFGSPFFCSVWGFTWELIPYYSVFLVFALSAFRTFALLRPMKQMRRRVVWRVLIGYLVFLIGRQLIGIFAGYSHYEYEAFSGYCWNHINYTNWQHTDAFFSFFQLAFPIIPITVSCILSTCVIYRSLSVSSTQEYVQRTKRKATVTIIIVTGVYILFNLPVFVNYTRYSIGVYFFNRDFLAGNAISRYRGVTVRHSADRLYSGLPSLTLRARGYCVG